ncbi:MAG: lysylphosphatidylglycerol synthase transmembrane domain-containing protein, partial [Anaerolineales bacterium]
MSPKTRSLLLNLLRIGLSAVLLTWVLSQAGLGRLFGVVSAADLRPYLLALLLGQAGIVIRAYRWKVLLDAVGARVPFRRAVYLYFVGAFFNTFLPTGFGGDVVRTLEAGPGTQSSQAAGTIVVDRLTGFIMLFVLALVALPL